MKILALWLLALAGASAGIAADDDGLLFSFFRNNGEDGLYLASSGDGLTWTVLNGNRPLLKPAVGESKLMRDPSIARGPDGAFHMVWTTSWQGKTIGYATSKDLVHWSAQRAIPVMADEPGVMNCWAPEVFFDSRTGDFLVLWASTIRGKFAETQTQGERDYNHRLYSFRTRDFKTIGQVNLFYDPGFSVIDAAIFPNGSGYAMVAKNETAKPPAKFLFLSFADKASGPWSKAGEPIFRKEWAEGPSPIRIGDEWYVYFDKYRSHRYGAIRSRDLKQWEDISGQVVFPEGTRHGTAFRAPRSVIAALVGR